MSQPPWPLSPSSFHQPEASIAKKLSAPNSPSSHDQPYPIIAFSHLGWDWVWQRPQQFLSRFAKRHRVLFVETYRSDVETTHVDLRTPEGHPNLVVLQMHLPGAR